MPPVGTGLTEGERQVARMLCRLQETIREFDPRGSRRRIPSLVLDNHSRGNRRRRSLPKDQPRPLPAPPTPSPVLPPPPLPVEEEGVEDRQRPASVAAVAARSSLAMPLYFQGSGEEDKDAGPSAAAPSRLGEHPEDKDAGPSAAAPSRPGEHPEDNGAGPSAAAPLPPARQSKNTKRRKEKQWVEEQRQKIALLVDEQANLKTEIEEYRGRLESLRSGRHVLGMTDATQTPSQLELHLHHPPASASGLRPVEATLSSGREVELQTAHDKVASREARKRRMDIRREKKSCVAAAMRKKARRDG